MRAVTAISALGRLTSHPRLKTSLRARIYHSPGSKQHQLEPRPDSGCRSCPAPPASHGFSGSPTGEPGAGCPRIPPAPCRAVSTAPGTSAAYSWQRVLLAKGLSSISIPRATPGRGRGQALPPDVEVSPRPGLGVAHLVVGLQQQRHGQQAGRHAVPSIVRMRYWLGCTGYRQKAGLSVGRWRLAMPAVSVSRKSFRRAAC